MGFVSMSVLFKAFVALQLLVSVYGLVDDSQAEYLVKKPPVVAPVVAPILPPKPSPPHPSPYPSPPPVKKPPVIAPISPPKPSPPHPSPYPSPPPVYSIRKSIAVQGVVYCRSCKYPGSNTLNGASPLPDAIVKLKCNNGKKPITVDGKTDKNGYFFIQAPKKISSFGVHKCRVVLVSSPLASCKNITNLNGGLTGGILRFEKPTKPLPFALYTVGPFAFGPTKCY